MLIETYDLTGNPQRALYNDKGIDDVSLAAHEPLRDLLIKPRRGKNREAYLQNTETPNLEDFWDEENHTYSFGNAYSLADILKRLSDGVDVPKYTDLLKAYFYALKGEQASEKGITRHIITVPDNYDAQTQECILRNSLPRSNTQLLWRSVAAILGAENQLRACGVKSGDKVAVIDIQQRYTDVSIMEVEIEGDYVVPVRQAYRRGMRGDLNTARYPMHEGTKKTKAVGISKGSEMLKGSFRQSSHEPLPIWYGDDSGWRLESPAVRELHSSFDWEGVRTKRIPDDVKCCLICSAFPISDSSQLQMGHSKVVLENKDQNFILDGAAKYAVRLQNGLSTYYDECEGLYFVTQKEEEEIVVPVPLIPKNERCKGGKTIIGDVYEKATLDKETEVAKFMLLLGGENLRQTPLKQLEQKVPPIPLKSRLRLVPTFIPGQGMAHVKVDCDLFNEPVVLDLLKMESTSKTIEQLENELDRSYPADTPPTVASEDLWKTVEWEVRHWLDNEFPTNGDWFAKQRKPLPNILDMLADERDLNAHTRKFLRINVFGSEEEKPSYMSSALYDRIIDRLYNEYNENKNSDIVKLISWSYQKNTKKLADIKADLLEKCLEALNSSGSLMEPYRTARSACANMLSTEEEFWKFTERYRSYIRKKLDAYKKRGAKLEGIDDWNRVMGIMLMSNNTMLQFKNHPHASKVCTGIIKNTLSILKIYLSNFDKDKRYITPLLKIIFFTLRRRRFEPKPTTFMKDFEFENSLIEISDLIKNRCSLWRKKECEDLDKLCNIILDYIRGKGKLEGVPDLTDD